MISTRIRTLTVSYGPHASQCAEVHLPRGEGPHPAVALLHGGLWRASQGSDPMRPIARHLARNGYAALNVEYRRLGEQGAGWPGTFLDAVDGVALAGRSLRVGRTPAYTPVLDASRVAIVGHCSGGHLALWAAAWLCGLWLGPEWIGPALHERGEPSHPTHPTHAKLNGHDHRDPADRDPADTMSAVDRPDRIGVRAVVALAPVTDLRAAERDGLDLPTSPPTCPSGPLSSSSSSSPMQRTQPAAAELLGGSQVAVAGRYRLGSPLELLPVGREVAQLLVHGDADEVVPIEHSLRYAHSAERAGDRVRVARFPGMGHFDMLDPEHEAWQLAFGHLREHLDN
jgi:acetyl esterase/lipase